MSQNKESQSTTEHALTKIAEQASTGTSISTDSDGWIAALPELETVACEFKMMDSLCSSYLWFESGAFRASNLGPGLDHKEERALDRFEAAALLDGGLSYKPVAVTEAK